MEETDRWRVKSRGGGRKVFPPSKGGGKVFLRIKTEDDFSSGHILIWRSYGPLWDILSLPLVKGWKMRFQKIGFEEKSRGGTWGRAVDPAGSLRPQVSSWSQPSQGENLPNSTHSSLKSCGLSSTSLCQASTMDFLCIIAGNSHHDPMEIRVITYIPRVDKEIWE